jgi:hypothetical protein
VKRLDRRLSLPHGPFTGSDEDGGDQRTSQRAIRQSARARAVRAAVRASEGALRSAGATSATAR